MTIRTFTAVTIDDTVRAALAATQAELRRVPVGVKWVQPENIHLTLVFLGDIEEESAADLCDALETAVAPLEPFSFEIDGLGSFGRPGAPRIVWAGTRGSSDALRRLHAAITGALSERGCTFDEKPFSPHLTLGRVKAPRGAEALEKRIIHNRETAFGTVHVHDVILMKSELRPSGPAYSIVRTLPLQAETDTNVAGEPTA